MAAACKPSCTVLCSGPVPQNLTLPPRMKKILLPFPVSWVSLVLQLLLLPLVSLPLFSGPLILLVTLLHSLNYFHFCCHCYLMTFLRSTRYITTAFMLASGHPGLEIKRLYYWTLYSAQKHHSLWRMHSGHNVHQTCELTYVIGHANICSPLWKLKDHNLKVCV